MRLRLNTSHQQKYEGYPYPQIWNQRKAIKGSSLTVKLLGLFKRNGFVQSRLFSIVLRQQTTSRALIAT